MRCIFCFANGFTPETMLSHIPEGLDLKITDELPARFFCNCSWERVADARRAIGSAELDQTISDGKPIDMNCHFCNTDYHFSLNELRNLRSSLE